MYGHHEKMRQREIRRHGEIHVERYRDMQTHTVSKRFLAAVRYT